LAGCRRRHLLAVCTALGEEGDFQVAFHHFFV